MRSLIRILSADFSAQIPFGEVNPLNCNSMICFLSSSCEMMLYSQEDSSSFPKQMCVEKLTHMTFFPWCRWKKSCTTWDVWIPVNNGRNYQAQLVPTTYVWYGAYGPHIFPLSPLLVFINFSCFKASCSILRLPHDLRTPLKVTPGFLNLHPSETSQTERR